MKIVKFGFIPVIVLGIIFIFAFQPEILVTPVFEGKSIPMGSLISWLGLFLFVLFFYFVLPLKNNNRLERILKRILFTDVLLAASWGVISYLLLENWAFNFDSSFNSFLWIGITIFILLLPLLILMILGISRLVF